MKKRIIISVFLALVMVLSLSVAVLADKPADNTKGNGLPKDMGKSYNFNVIGVPGQKNWDPNSFDTGGNGKRIFILRDGTTFVYVHGDNVTHSIEILDRDGTDGYVGINRELPGILLPYTGTLGAGTWDCTVYIRMLGKPDGQIDWKTSVYDGTEYVEVATFTLKRERFSKFQIQGNKILRDDYQDILWQWDTNEKFRIMQFRIYMGAPDGGYPPPD